MAPKKWGPKPPAGYEVVEPIIEALENELRDKVKESNVGKRNTESIWPVHQINWQRTRYVYDMYHRYHRISRKVYDYCVKNKVVDAALVAKWKKPGYERLCSTYVINPANYKFGTTSICRVPLKDRSEMQIQAQDPTTGCLGCASGKDGGPSNIFGNKYGQNLAAVQVAREKRMELMRVKREQQEREQEEKRQREKEESAAAGGDSETDDDDEETSDDDDDYGPTPVAGIWAGSRKLEAESEKIDVGDEGDEETDDEEPDRPAKKARAT